MAVTTKKKNMVSALVNYFKTGDEANLHTDAPSISGKLQSEAKKTVGGKESDIIGKPDLVVNEIADPFHQITDPSLKKGVLKALELLKAKYYEYKYTSVDSRSFILSFTSSNHITSFDTPTRFRITRLDEPDQYKIENEGIDPSSFKELVKCTAQVIPDIIESLVSMADNNCH